MSENHNHNRDKKFHGYAFYLRIRNRFELAIKHRAVVMAAIYAGLFLALYFSGVGFPDLLRAWGDAPDPLAD